MVGCNFFVKQSHSNLDDEGLLSMHIQVNEGGAGGDSIDRLEVVLPSGSLIPSRQLHSAVLTAEQTSFTMEIFETQTSEGDASALKLARVRNLFLY